MKKIFFTVLSIFSLPFVALAQGGGGGGGGGGSSITTLLNSVKDIVNLLIPLLIGVAMVAFFWGLIKYIWGGGKDTAKGKAIMTAGIISLFVMVSIWGIITFVQNSLQVGTVEGGGIPAPQIKYQ